MNRRHQTTTKRKLQYSRTKKTYTLRNLPTGIAGFDEVAEGGVPEGRCYAVCGRSGTGKTVFLNEFIYRGITRYNHNGVYVTLDEKPESITGNCAGFGWEYPSLIKAGKLRFIDMTPSDQSYYTVGRDFDLHPILLRIIHAVKANNARRVAIDGLAALFHTFPNHRNIRDIIYRLTQELKALGVTTFFSVELVGSSSGSFSRYGVEDFVADGVVDMELVKGEQRFIRKLFIRKLRGTRYRSGEVELEINRSGIRVFPKIPLSAHISKTSFKKRLSTGIPQLDRAIEGGIPQGHIVLVSGNTGTGKSLLALQFLYAGIAQGEKALFLSLEEPVEQVLKTAQAHGWKFKHYVRNGQIVFLSPGLIDINPDKLLYDIKDCVESNAIKRVAIDSISSILSASLDREKVRQFLIQLNGYFKMNGISCIMNYLATTNFGAQTGQLLGGFNTNELRLSSVTDGIIILRYVEQDAEVKKLMTILKMRGSNHAREIMEYSIARGGITL
jgi:circadian clock protein KaiC